MLYICEAVANLKSNKLLKCLHTRTWLLFYSNMQYHVSKVHKHTERRVVDKYLFNSTCKTHKVTHTLSCIHTVHVRLCYTYSFNPTHRVQSGGGGQVYWPFRPQ